MLAMQKVEGSNPFSRSPNSALQSLESGIQGGFSLGRRERSPWPGTNSVHKRPTPAFVGKAPCRAQASTLSSVSTAPPSPVKAGGERRELARSLCRTMSPISGRGASAASTPARQRSRVASPEHRSGLGLARAAGFRPPFGAALSLAGDCERLRGRCGQSCSSSRGGAGSTSDLAPALAQEQ
jgi:hypothetical protein